MLKRGGLGRCDGINGLNIGFRSWGGDSVKHSSRVGVSTHDASPPTAPNVKAGSWLSLGFKMIVLVENPFVRDSDGRGNGFLRLKRG